MVYIKTESERMRKYKEYLKEEAEKFRLISTDLSNLYDVLEMADCPAEMNQDFRGTLILNRLDKWFRDFKWRIMDIVIPELKK